jgi:hypothetical protein
MKDFSRSVKLRINSHSNNPMLIRTNLCLRLTIPGKRDANMRECNLEKVTHRMRMSRSKHKIVARFLLKHKIHPLDIVLCVSPVALGVDVSEMHAFLLSKRDPSNGDADLARDEILLASRALVVEKDPIAGVHAVRFSIINCDPVCKLLGDAVRRAGVEGSCLGLRDNSDVSIQLARTCLIELCELCKSAFGDCVQDAKGSDSVDVSSILWLGERVL